MHSTPMRFSLPTRSRKTSIASLMVLFAFAGTVQMLVPTSAAAMINQQVGTCSSVVGNLGWNHATNEPCTLTQGGGGGGGGAAIPGTGRPGEIIEVHDPPAPTQEPSPIPCPVAVNCLPPGGGTKGSIPGRLEDGGRPPRGVPATKAPPKPPKALPKEMTKKEKEAKCQALLSTLQSRIYREVPGLWEDIQGLDPSLDGEPYILEVKDWHNRLQTFLKQWRGMGCTDLLGKRLPPEYSR